MTPSTNYAVEATSRYRKLSAGGGLSALAARGHQNIQLVFVRGRAADASNLTPSNNHFSYPPPEKCLQYGRANIPHHPVFYAGESPQVIADELRLEPGSWLHLAVFYTPAPVQFEYLLLLHDALAAENTWSQVRDELHQHLSRRSDLPGSVESVWSQIQDAAQLFRGDDYQTTSAISHHWLYTQGLDAVLYPSLRNDRWCNFAIHPRFADKLAQHCVLACRWIGSNIEIHHTGVAQKSGELQWRPTTRDDWEQFNSVYSNLTR